jgi:tRNA threonylcarbamoyladenosine biosynthesis protein TsaE
MAGTPRRAVTLELTTRSAEETQALGERLAAALAPGDVIGLTGQLGAGKTTLIQGLGRGLGADESQVKSPTFILMREYAGRVPLIHIDAYRLEDASSAVWLDMEWLFSPRKVTVMEWAERLADCLPEDHLHIEMTHKSAHQRAIRLTARGPRSAAIIEALRAAMSAPTVAPTGERDDASSVKPKRARPASEEPQA